MANAATGWTCTQNVSIIAETNTTVTVRVICYWKNQGWDYHINLVSAWVYMNGSSVQVKPSGWVDTRGDSYASFEMGYHDFVVNKTTSVQSIPFCSKITSESSYSPGTKWSGDQYVDISAKPSYTISYNANGGTGAPGNQTKWYGTDIIISSSKPTRTGYTFVRWNGGTHGYYTPGATYSGNANMTLTAEWKANTYVISYNANGGSGAPGNQTKTYGVNLTLSATKPTRTNYNFLGWSTSANGGVVYASGGTYTANTAVTLYAVWELAYIKPRLTNYAANRCTSNGTISETGTYVKVTFDWTTDRTVTAIYIQHKLQTSSTWTSTKVTASGTSGSVSQVIGDGNLSTENSYHVRSYVSDSSGDDYTTYSSIASIGTIKFPIDVKAGGTGVAIGKVAEKDVFEVGMPAEFPEGLTSQGKDVILKTTFAVNADFNSITESGTYTCSSTPTGANIPIASAGILEVFNFGGMITQRYTTYHGIFIFIRCHYNNTWQAWHNIGSTIMATATPNDRYVLSAPGWTPTKVNCDKAICNTSLGMLTLSDGGIKIGKNINTIKISASICFFEYQGLGEIDIIIIKNSTRVSQNYGEVHKIGQIFSVTTNPTAINVVEGDVITLHMVKANDSDLTIIHNLGATSLTVEVIN